VLIVLAETDCFYDCGRMAEKRHWEYSAIQKCSMLQMPSQKYPARSKVQYFPTVTSFLVCLVNGSVVKTQEVREGLLKSLLNLHKIPTKPNKQTRACMMNDEH